MSEIEKLKKKLAVFEKTKQSNSENEGSFFDLSA
jgi:hypothetical protein